MTTIAICAPGKAITREAACKVEDIAATRDDVTLRFHPQCFARDGHFAGDDATRLAAFLECANDPATDAVWFAAGGYGSNRIAADAVGGLDAAGARKAYLGYSDTGYLLAELYRTAVGVPVHGPMVSDIGREGGAAAIERALDWLAGVAADGEADVPTVAFNLTTLAMLCGTGLMPDLTGHVVMVEEVGEYLYAVDRLFFHIAQHLGSVAGLRLGRVSQVPENDRPFGATAEEIAQYWCAKAGIAYLGRADIGHDADNSVVPFGLARIAWRA